MKQYLLSIFFFLCNSLTYSQEFKELFLEMKTFEDKYEFDNVHCQILEVVDYIITHPYNEDTMAYDCALETMLKWIPNTDNYHLIIGGKVLEDTDKGSLMQTIFKVCMIKFLFENDHYVHPRSQSGLRYVNIHEIREIINGGAEIFMQYLSKQEKKVINKKLYKGLKLYNEGRLKEYMGS